MTIFPPSCEKKLMGVVVALVWLTVGCSGTQHDPDKFMGEGFRASLPPPGTRVLVWGNHNGALTRTAGWLHEQGLIVVDQAWVEKEIKDPAIHLRSRAERSTQVLEAAKVVNAELVVFTTVEENQLGRKFSLAKLGSQPMSIAWVEVRAIEPRTGDVVFGAKAWNSEPMAVSETAVLNLTSLALQKAWTDGKYPSAAPVDVVTHERPSASAAEPAGPLMVEEKLEPQEILSHHDEESVQPDQHAEQPVAADSEESSLNSEKSSLGLQVASGALSILYTPLKVVYAGMGGLVGGLAYVLTAGNEQTAQTIWDSSLEGDYWVTPQHLKGNEPLNFRGQPKIVNVAQRNRLEE